VRTRFFWTAGLALIAAGGLLAARLTLGRREHYRLERIDRGPIRSELTASGTVSAVAAIEVASPVPGAVARLYADANSVVKRGQPLAQLDLAPFRDAIARQEAAVRRSRARGARGALAKAQAGLAQAKRTAARATIRAPIAGVVIARTVAVGQSVGPGSAAPALFTIARDLSHVQVQARVAGSDAGQVAVGEAALFRCDGYPGHLLPGTVSEVHAAAAERAADSVVLVDADNRDHRLRPGMAATVSIEVARREGVLRLPLAALSFVPPGMEPVAPLTPHVGCVFVLDHGRPHPVRVTLGLRDALHAELVAGPLHEGDAVIVAAAGSQRAASVR
jgi:HlyD family secretion protein